MSEVEPVVNRRTRGRETKIEVLAEQDGTARTILLQCCPAAIAERGLSVLTNPRVVYYFL